MLSILLFFFFFCGSITELRDTALYSSCGSNDDMIFCLYRLSARGDSSVNAPPSIRNDPQHIRHHRRDRRNSGGWWQPVPGLTERGALPGPPLPGGWS